MIPLSTKLKKKVIQLRGLILLVSLLLLATISISRQNKVSSLRFKRSVFQGMIRHDYLSNSSGTENLIYFGLISDRNSYGVNRNFNNYLDVLVAQGQKHTTLALLISSKDEFESASQIIKTRSLPEFSRVVLLLDKTASGLARGDRHLDSAQKLRRRRIALLRNTLIYSTLQNEEFSVWMDADIIDITPGTVNKMIQSKKDIITPGCQWGKGGGDYDQNAWKGKRIRPSPEELEGIKNGKTFVPRPIRDGEGAARFVLEMRTDGEDFVELDSVGGTLLFVKSEIFRKGANFPVYYVIGADWEMAEGYDGIETEGICYVARTLGYKCWGMPNDGNLLLYF